jgi:hypothetical protein
MDRGDWRQQLEDKTWAVIGWSVGVLIRAYVCVRYGRED